MILPKPQPAREPSPPWPVVLYPDDLHKLGEIAGRPWFTAPAREGEFELLREAPIPDRGLRSLVGGQPYLWDQLPGRDGMAEVVWRPLRHHPSGTYANGGKHPAPPQQASKTKPLRSVDGLALLLPAVKAEIKPFLPEKEEAIIPLTAEQVVARDIALAVSRAPVSPGAILTTGREAIRGVGPILSYINRKLHVTLEPDRFGCHLDVRSQGGALAEGGREMLHRLTPLIAPSLGASNPPPVVDGPLHCHGNAHTGEPATAPLAMTLGPCDMPLCAECTGR